MATERTRRAGVWVASAALAVAVFLLVWGSSRERRTRGPTEPVEPIEAVADVEARVAGHFEDGADWSPMPGAARFSAGAVEWSDGAGAPWLEARRLSANISLGTLGADRVVLSDVRLEAPVLRLERGAGGTWNFERAFAGDGGRAGESGGAGGGIALVITGGRMQSGRVSVVTPDLDYLATSVNARLAEARFGGTGGGEPFVRLASLDARVAPRGGESQPLALSDAVIRFGGDRIAFEVDRLALSESVVANIEGIYSGALPGLGIRARGTAPSVDFADLHRLIPRFPESGTASFAWSIESLAADRIAVRMESIDLQSGESRVAGSITVLLGGPGTVNLGATDLRLDPVDLALVEQILGRTLPYSGTVSGSLTGAGETLRFDLDTRLLAEGVSQPIVTRLQGTLSLAGDQPTLGGVVANFDELPLRALSALVPGLPLQGVLSGSVAFEGDPRSGPLQIDATLTVAQGVIELNGTVSLAGGASYDLTGSITDVRLQRILSFEFPPVLLDARFSLVGSGTDVATADARLELDGRFSGWRAGAADIVSFHATIDDGEITVERGVARLATATLSTSGTWRIVEPTGGSIGYDLAVTSVEPFGPYLPGGSIGSTGSIQAEGTLSGTLDRPRIAGTVQMQDLRWGDWAAQSAAATHDLVMTDSLPHLEFDGTAVGLVTPTLGSYERAEAHLTLLPPTFDLVLDADRLGGGALQVVADGRMPPGAESEAVLRTVIVDLAEERWALASPASIRWDGGVVSVDDLAVTQVDGPGLISLDGRVLPLSDADFAFDLRSLPLADVQRLFSREPVVSGRLWSAGRFTAVGGTPSATLDFRVEDGAAQDLAFASLSGDARYDGRRLFIDAAGALADPGGAVTADVAIPILLSVADSAMVELGETGGLDGQVDFERVPLELVERFTDAVTEAEGFISGTMTLAGTAQTPIFGGSLRIQDGAVTVPELSKRFTEIGGTVTLDEQVARFQDVRVRSDGYATLSGTVSFEELDDPVADLTVALDGFRPMGVDGEEDVAAWGEIEVNGPLSAPVISGEVSLNDGALEIPGGGPVDPFADELDLLEGTAPIEVEGLPGADAPTFGAFTVQGLTVDAGDDVWFVTDEVRARLAGELTVFHSSGDTRVFGTLSGDRGTFTLRIGTLGVRRFEIIDASIRFFGTSDLNPGLDVTAARTVGSAAGEPVQLQVHVGGTMERPTLSLSTVEGTPIPESQLLSFLLFGTPSFGVAQLGGVTQATSTLLSLVGVSDFLGVELQEAGVPIDYIQIRSSDVAGAENDLYVTVGIELDNDVFLTADAPLSTSGEQNTFAFAVEWRIDSQWTLEAGLEPVIRRQALGLGLSAVVGATDAPPNQWLIEVRRRWTY